MSIRDRTSGWGNGPPRSAARYPNYEFSIMNFEFHRKVGCREVLCLTRGGVPGT